MAMWWFNRRKRPEIWDEAIVWPIGDIEAAQRIRDICRSAADSAEKIGGFARVPDTGKSSDERKRKHEVGRYERAAETAMQIAMKMSDDLMRDSSLGQIVGLCMKANDLETARVLLRAIRSGSIRMDVLKDHPVLRK